MASFWKSNHQNQEQQQAGQQENQQQQPGSNDSEQSGDPKSPASRQKMLEKRELRDLNTRLELYVHNQRKKQQAIEAMRNTLAKQEIEFRNKMREKEIQFNQINEKLRSENESLQYQTKSLNEELQTAETSNLDLQQRVETSEKRVREKESEIEHLTAEMQNLRTELSALRTENADIKYQYENHDNERKTLLSQYRQLKEKNATLMKDLTKRQSEARSHRDAFQRLLNEKSTEIDRLVNENKTLLSEKVEMQDRLRSEFDTKLTDYIAKREEQYKQEKEEWMRIFKQEFNRKLRSYKDANGELTSNNNKLEEEINDLKQRVNKLKQSKSDLELNIRSMEEECEKHRSDFDDYKSVKESELKLKQQTINELKEHQKQRDIEYDEVVGIKIQLAQEIELYRRILSDAEQSAGYASPLASNRNKKMKFCDNNGNSIFDKDGNIITAGGPNYASNTTATPGIIRGAQLARQDLNRLNTISSNNGTNTDVDTEIDSENEENNENDSRFGNTNMNMNGNKNRNKNKGKSRKRNRKNMYKNNNGNDARSDGESKDGSDNEEENDNENDGGNNGQAGGSMEMDQDYVTPGGEPWPLQFSTMDLTRSMIEIQNISDASVSLRGYTLSNSDGSAQFALPNDRVLAPYEKLKVMIGLRAKTDGKESSILWKADVWAGDEEDVARLYDPNSQEIARIEIHPDMLPRDKKNGANCAVM